MFFGRKTLARRTLQAEYWDGTAPERRARLNNARQRPLLKRIIDGRSCDVVEAHCETCHLVFFPRLTVIRRGNGRYCTLQCANQRKRGRIDVINKRAYVDRFRAKYPEKAQVHDAVEAAIRRGQLVRTASCQACQTVTRTQAHHEDYSKPLAVTWLCRPCHTKHHADVRAQRKRGIVAA